MTTSTYTLKLDKSHFVINQPQNDYKLRNKSFLLLFSMVLFFVLAHSTVSWGQLLSEPFNYTPHATNDLVIQSSNVWSRVNTGDSILVTSGSLNYAGLQPSIGNKVTYGGAGTDYYTAYSSQTSGTVYCSFLLNITALGSLNTTGGYTIGLLDGTTSNFAATVWLRLSGANFNIGINPRTTTANTVWLPNTLSVNTTYLVVIANKIISGITNDSVKIWLNPISFGGSEPPYSSIAANAGTDLTSFQRVFLRQDAASATPGTIQIDEMRVGTTWASVTPPSAPNLSVSGPTAHGTYCVGTAGNPVRDTIYNTGATATGISLTSNNPQFAVIDTPSIIPANGFATFNVTFTPSSGGAQSAAITVTSTTPGSNSSTINLSGSGIASVSPVVFSDPASGITNNSATLNGNVTTLGVCPSTTEKGFVYSQTSVNNNPLVGGTGVVKQTVAGLTTGTYSYGLTGLPASTGYSYKSYVYNNATYSYGSVTTFTTDAPPSSVISTTGSLSDVSTTYGTASVTPTTFTVSGTGLADDITINAPLGFEISSGGTYSTSLVLVQTGGNVSNTTIYVRLSATTIVGSYSGNITLTSTGSNNPTVATVLSSVTPKALTILNALANDKIYDGNTNATISGTLNGVVNNDIVTLSGIGLFVSSNAGTAIAITSTSNLGGANASNYTLTQPTGLTANIAKANQTISFSALLSKTFNNPPFKLTASASSGLPVTYVSSNTSVATISNDTVTIVGAGSTLITASQVGNNNYNPAPDSSQTLTVNQATQFITFATIPNKTINDAPFPLSATASSGLSISYVSSNTAVATVSGNTVTIQGVGTTIITASQPGNTNYLPATDVTRNLTVTYPLVAAWDFTGLNTVATAAATTFSTNLNTSNLITRGAGAAASSGANSFRTTGFQNNGISPTNTDYFQVTLGASSGKALSLSSIDANFNGTSGFFATPGVTSQFAFSLNGTNFTLIGSPVTSTSLTMPQVTLTGVSALQNVPSGSTITIRYYASGQTATGGWGFFSSAAGINGLAFAGNVAPIVAPVINSSLTASGNVASPFSYNITATNNPTSFTATGLPSGLSINTITGAITGTPVSAGTTNVSITATNAGGSDNQTLVITIGPGNQTITFGALGSKTYGDAPFNLTATASSGLTVTYVSSNNSVATISGNTVTIVSAGTVNIIASQIGNANYNAAPDVTQSLTINKADQIITFGPLSNKLTTDPPFNLTASSSSTLSVSYSSSNTAVVSISGNTATLVGPGTAIITASQSGNGNYNAAMNVAQSQVVIDPNAPILSANSLSGFGNVCLNYVAGPDSFLISGYNLNSDSITVDSLPGMTYSTDNHVFSAALTIIQPGGTFSQTIYVQFTPTAVQSYNGTIKVSGGGAPFINVPVSGSGVNTTASVTTDAATGVTQIEATLPATITNTGCSSVTGYGIEYSLINGFANGAGTPVSGTNLSGGVYSINLTGLNPNTSYYYKAFVNNAGGIFYGTQMNFTTLSLGSPVATAATAIAQNSFTANWNAVSGATSYNLDVSTSNTFTVRLPIVSENFENSMSAFTSTAGTGVFYTGNSVTGDLPAASPFASLGSYAFGKSNGSVTISSGNINTTAYSGVQMNFKLASFSINSTGNGADASDNVNVEVSPDGGITYYSTVKISGNSNAAWAYSATGIASAPYDGNATPVSFQPISGGLRADGFSTVGITNLPSTTNLKIRITLLNNSANERWLIDDFSVTGIQGSFVPGYQNLSVAGNSQSVTGLTGNTFYYYRVRAVSNSGTTGNSNTITALTCTTASLATSVINPSCNGSTNGSISVIATGGTLPYGYLWSNAQTTSTIAGLSQGTYTVTVTSNTGCPATAVVPLSVIPLTSVSISAVSNAICLGDSITLSNTVTGGGLPFHYSWSDGTSIVGTSSSIKVSPSITTSYSLTVTDSCSNSVSTTFTLTINSNPNISVSPASANSCSTNPGTITLTASGNSDSYTWSPAIGLDVTTGSVVHSTTAFNIIYTATGIISSTGCKATVTASITSGNPITVAAAATPVNICNGGSTQLNAVANIPVSNSYSVTAVSYVAPVPNNPTTITSFTDPDDGFASLALPFSFTYFGQSYNQIYIATNGFVSFTDLTGVTGAQLRAVTAFPDVAVPNNRIAICLTDLEIAGSAAIKYWTSGSDFVINFDKIQKWNSATQKISGYIILHSANNTIDVLIGNSNITSAQTLGIENSTGTLGKAVAGRNNSIWSVSTPEAWRFAPIVPSVTLPLYSWSPVIYLNNANIANPYASGITNGPIKYKVIATDPVGGCTAIDSVVINTSIVTPSPKVYPGDSLLCSGQSFYQHVIDTGAYSNGYPIGTTIDWVGISNGLSPDDSVNTSGFSNFAVIVHLPNASCSTLSSTAQVSTHQLNVITDSIQPSPCGSNTGYIKIHVDGTAPFRFSWTDGTNNIHNVQTNSPVDSIINLTGGFYYLTVIDNYGNVNPGLSCTAGPLTYFVSSQGGPSVSITSVTNANCFGVADGSAEALATGGTGNLSYEWFSDSNTPSGNGLTSDPLAAGNYYVQVTDANLCVDTAQFTIGQPTQIILTPGSISATCGNSDGTASIQAQGGNPPYSYTWYNNPDLDASHVIGTNNNTVTDLAPGIYYVVVSDGHGCLKLASVTIGQQSCAITLNLKLFIEGFYIGGGQMQPVLWNADNNYPNMTDCDSIIVELYDSVNLVLIVSTIGVLHIDGTAIVLLPPSTLNGLFYLVIKHRNAIETWSKHPITIGNITNFDFTIPE